MTEPPSFPSYEPEPRLPAHQPPRPAMAGHRLGKASGVRTRVEGQGHERSSETVLSFRILDPAGQPAEVELRGRTLFGSVHEGDWVELVDRRAKSGRFEVRKLTNLTTASEVAASGGVSPGVNRVAVIVFVLIFIAVLVIILVGTISMFSEPF